MGGTPPVVLVSNGRRTVFNPRGRTRLEIIQESDRFSMTLKTPKGKKVFAQSVHESMQDALLAGVKAAAKNGRIRLPLGCRPNMRFIIIKRRLVCGIAIKHPKGYLWWLEAIVKPFISKEGGVRWYAKVGPFINECDEFDDPFEALVCALGILMATGRWR